MSSKIATYHYLQFEQNKINHYCFQVRTKLSNPQPEEPAIALSILTTFKSFLHILTKTIYSKHILQYNWSLELSIIYNNSKQFTQMIHIWEINVHKRNFSIWNCCLEFYFIDRVYDRKHVIGITINQSCLSTCTISCDRLIGFAHTKGKWL